MTIPRHLIEISDEEEARIQEMIASDPDAPEATDEELAQARPFHEVFPELARAIDARQQAHEDQGKEVVRLSLDRDVLEKFKATGPGWQKRINEALRKAAV